MQDIVKSVLEVLKLAPRYLAAVALIAGALIFLPGEWIQFLGLKEFSDKHRAWLGLAFLVSVGISLVAIGIWLIDTVKGAVHARKIRKYILKKLHNLTEDEKQILRYYFVFGTRSNTLKVDDGVVQELVACRIIYRSANLGSLLEGFSHNISDLAWDYIQENPSVLNGSTNTYRTDKLQTGW